MLRDSGLGFFQVLGRGIVSCWACCGLLRGWGDLGGLPGASFKLSRPAQNVCKMSGLGDFFFGASEHEREREREKKKERLLLVPLGEEAEWGGRAEALHQGF